MAHVSNSIQGRQLLGGILGLPSSIDIPIFPLPTRRPNDASSSSQSLSSTSTSASTSTSVSASSSSSSTSTVTPSTTSSLPSDTTTPVQPLPSSHTVTVFQSASTSSAAPSTTAVAAANKSFLQNKVLSGIVFALVGVIGLVLLILLATFAIRRRRNKKLINEALAFDPVKLESDYGPNMMETGRRPTDVRSSSSTGHASNGNGPIITHAAAFADYAPPVVYIPAKTPNGTPYIQQRTPPQGLYNGTVEPYKQSYNWTGAPAQQNIASDQRSSNSAAPELEKSRRSRSSSTEIKFAPPSNTPGSAR